MRETTAYCDVTRIIEVKLQTLAKSGGGQKSATTEKVLTFIGGLVNIGLDKGVLGAAPRAFSGLAGGNEIVISALEWEGEEAEPPGA